MKKIASTLLALLVFVGLLSFVPNNVIATDLSKANEVDLYLFWGDGCPHCAKEKEFLSNSRATLKSKIKENNERIKELEESNTKLLGEKKALELLKYLSDNKEWLRPYKERGIKVPDSPKGITYKNLWFDFLHSHVFYKN